MKHPFFKKALPHVIAILIFLIIAVIYCRPTLEGKVLQQSDTVHWKAMAQNSFEYYAEHGHYPLWNTHLFSGMPNYQIMMEGKHLIPNFHALLTLGLPTPIAFFFLACLCFYILSQVMRLHYLVSIFSSLAFAYCSYDPVIISVGHESKMLAIAYMPGVLAGLLLIYQRKYLIGLAVAALFASYEVGVTHPQINYYLLIAIGIITLGYILAWIRAREWKHLFISLSVALLAGFIAFANSSITLLTTRDYTQYTMRGGKALDINGADIKKVDTKGLDLDYAFQYSFGKSEFLTFFMPDVFGSSSSEVFDEDSRLVSILTDKNIPEGSAIQLAGSLPRYWGGIEPSTAGPVYFGAIVFFLAVIALVIVKHTAKWWILAAIVFSLFMAWGSYFPGFNNFLFDYMPLYNKFRAPSMSLVIPQLLFPLLAGMGLQQIFFDQGGRELLKQSVKPICYALGGVFILTGLIYLFSDFSGSVDGQIIQVYSNPQNPNAEGGRMIVSALKEARKAMFGAGITRALAFLAGVVVLLYLHAKNSIKPVFAVVVFLLVNTIDLLAVDSKYLNQDNYLDKDSYAADNFAQNAADTEIAKDKDPHFRVYNLAPDRFSDAITSYHHRSVGGYHAAKLSIYQDLISAQLSKSPMNMPVLNMLDTRYLILPASQEHPYPSVHKNDEALGAAWFVKHIQYVNGPVEEIKALDDFNPKDTVIVDVSYQSIAGKDPVADSSASIQLVNYDNDAISYSTEASTNQFAVFSEVFYPSWNAYLDGVKVPYAKVNYVLRGMPVPAGKHTIEFKFEPTSYHQGQQLVYLGNILLWLALAGAVLACWRNSKRGKAGAS